jgi:hypothetical protein
VAPRRKWQTARGRQTNKQSVSKSRNPLEWSPAAEKYVKMFIQLGGNACGLVDMDDRSIITAHKAFGCFDTHR